MWKKKCFFNNLNVWLTIAKEVLFENQITRKDKLVSNGVIFFLFLFLVCNLFYALNNIFIISFAFILSNFFFLYLFFLSTNLISFLSLFFFLFSLTDPSPYLSPPSYSSHLLSATTLLSLSSFNLSPSSHLTKVSLWGSGGFGFCLRWRDLREYLAFLQ